jgi:hypothetical protein
LWTKALRNVQKSNRQQGAVSVLNQQISGLSQQFLLVSKEILEIAVGTKQLAVVVLPWQTRTRYLFFSVWKQHTPSS